MYKLKSVTTVHCTKLSVIYVMKRFSDSHCSTILLQKISRFLKVAIL